MRFFSPPEKPTLSGRFSMSCVDLQSLPTASCTSFMKAGVVSSVLAARLALRVERGAQERHRADAGDLDRILEGEEHARRRRARPAPCSRRSSPLSSTSPSVTS